VDVRKNLGSTTVLTAPRAATPAQDPYAQFMPEKPKTEEALRAERIERERAGGYGQFSQASKDEAEFIKERKGRAGQDEKSARKDFWIMTGASLLGSRSPFFANALGDSVKENYGNLIKDLRDLKKEGDSIKVLEIQMRRAQETAAQTGDKEDRTEAQRLGAEYRNTGFQIQKLRDETKQKVLDRATNLLIAQLRMRDESGADARINRLTALQDRANEPGISPQEKATRTEQLNNELEFQSKATAATVGTAYAADQNREAKLDRPLIDLESESSFKFLTPEAQKLKRDQVIAAFNRSNSNYGPQSSNGKNPYPDFSAVLLDGG